MASVSRLLSLLLCAALGAESARVLMFVPIGGKSQKNVFYGLGSGLAARGHEVVFFNGFKPSSPVPGVREVVPDEMAKLFTDDKLPNMFKMNQEGMQAGLKQFLSFFRDGPRAAMDSKELEQLLTEKFDIVVFGAFCYPFYFIPRVLEAPFVFLTPVSYFPILTGALGSPTIPAIIPTPFVVTSSRMTFLNRVKNVVSHAFLNVVFRWMFAFQADRMIAEKFGAGAFPPVLDMERNASLVLSSSNPVMDDHRPLLPNVIEVGGMHCEAPKPLPKELASFLGDSEFVYFSLGSVVRPEDMTPEQRRTVLAVLGSLPFKVLLKWDTTERAGVPANVLPSRWLPQQDILGSSRCRLFVSHGGYASLVESVCHGVPLLMLPVTGDQNSNAVHACALGVAEQLTWDALTERALRDAVTAALSDAHRAAARHRRRLLETQPLPPRRLAVHWVEHVIEHGGAPHLRSVGADLNWAQYYSLDVLAFLLAVLALVLALLLWLLRAVLRCCCRCLCRKRADTSKAQQKDKRKHAKRE